MEVFESIFSSDYYVSLIAFVPPFVVFGMLLPFAPWAIGSIWTAFASWVKSV